MSVGDQLDNGEKVIAGLETSGWDVGALAEAAAVRSSTLTSSELDRAIMAWPDR